MYNQIQNDLREKFLKEARESIRQVEKREDILAAILTGSAAWGKPNPDGDLDILLITKNHKSVFYHYLIPSFYPVQRRTELGYIPQEVVAKNIKKGFGSQISCSMIEQLKNGRVLFQKDAFGDKLIESCRSVFPGRLVIGESITDIGKVFRELEENLNQGRFKDSVFMVRRAARLLVQTLLLAREQTGVAKVKHEHRAVKKFLSKGEAESYEELTDVRDVVSKEAHRTVQKAINLMKWVIEEHSISSGLVNYEQ